MLSKDRFQRIRDLFEQALEQPIGSRGQFLAERTQGDTSLAHEVATLLHLDGLNDSFLEPLSGRRIARAFGDLAESGQAHDPPPSHQPFDQSGQ